MSAVPGGYRDPDSQSRVRRAVITVAVLGVLAQLAIPLMMVLFTLRSALGLVIVEPQCGAWWKGSLWFVETEIDLLGGGVGSSELLRWTREDPDSVERMARFDVADPWLLPGADRLWIVAADAVGWLGARGIEIERVAPASPVVSAPFLWRGRPALVAETPSGRSLFSFEAGAWEDTALMDLGALEAEVDAEDIYVVDGEGDEPPWLFVRTGEALIARRGLAAPPAGRPDETMETAVAGADAFGQWAIGMLEGEPLLVTVRASLSRPKIAGYHRAEGEWVRRFTVEVGMPGKVGVFADEGNPGRVLVAYRSHSQSFTIWEIEDGEVLARFQPLGRPMEGGMLSGWQLADSAVSLLVPVLAVLLLAPVLARHRTAGCRFGDADDAAGEYASLPRRGLAKGIDGAIVIAPMALAAVLLMGSYLDVERTMGESLADLGSFLGVALLWSTVCLLGFSLLEARCGRTPGKRLAGIRVVSLAGGRVSLGRALLRNLLTIVDGSLGFLVGIVLVALTTRWQRLGDLAAKSVVVRG